MNWDALYKEAFAFRNTLQWFSLSDDQIFAIKVNGEVYYLSISGLPNDNPGLIVYPGDEGLRSFYRIKNATLDLEEYRVHNFEYIEDGYRVKSTAFYDEEYRIANIGQTSIQCVFLNKKDKSQEERKRFTASADHISIENLGDPHFFCVNRYQRAKEISENTEGEVLFKALKAAIWVANNILLITIPHLLPNTETIPLIVQDESDFHIETISITPNNGISYPVGHTDNTDLTNKVRHLPQRGKWACKLILLNEDHPSDGIDGKFFPWNLLTIDLKTNKFKSVRCCRDYEHRTNILLRELMYCLLKEKRRPESILVSDPRTESFLRDWCQDQNISLLQGNMPDKIDSMVNRNLYEQELTIKDTPKGLMQALDCFLFSPEEKLPIYTKYLDMIYTELANLDFPIMSDPLRKNIAKVLKRIKRRQNLNEEHLHMFGNEIFLIRVSMENGPCIYYMIPYTELDYNRLSTLADTIIGEFNLREEFDGSYPGVFFLGPQDCEFTSYYSFHEDDKRKHFNPHMDKVTLSEAGLRIGMKFKYLYCSPKPQLIHCNCRVLQVFDPPNYNIAIRYMRNTKKAPSD